MTTPGGDGSGPCAAWPVQWVCELDPGAAAVTGTAVASATEVLWALSGRRFGLCEVTLRPCRRDCGDGRFYDDFGPPWTARTHPRPALHAGRWTNLVCGQCTGDCSCTQISEAVLPAPVREIVRVTVDGQVLPPAAYRVDNNRLLVRTDGGRWPRCNNLSVADTEPGTWSVTALYGLPVPEAGRLAMGELACQIVMAAQGGDCRLPAGVQQLVRQGVTISYPDVGALLKDGRTGLYLVDMFLAAFNPDRLRNRSRVYRVDRPTVRRPGT